MSRTAMQTQPHHVGMHAAEVIQGPSRRLLLGQVQCLVQHLVSPRLTQRVGCSGNLLNSLELGCGGHGVTVEEEEEDDDKVAQK
jgi:hypothetical protein